MAATKPWVEYNWLSEKCGLKVSNICLGTMTMGKPSESFEFPNNTDKAESIKILNRYAELGGNFVDTANAYCNGETEEIIGSWMSSRDRGSVVLATKVFADPDINNDSHPNRLGLSRGAILYHIEASLKRLKTDYIDIYYMHMMDLGMNIEETLRTFDDLVRAGKIRYVGVSNFTGGMLQKFVDYSHFLHYTPCVTIQQEYSLGNRTSDIEVVPTVKREGLSLVPYSPLQGGLLTGKFKRNDPNRSKSLAGTRVGWALEKPELGAFTTLHSIANVNNDDRFWKLMGSIEEIGKQHGKTPGQVSLRWLLQKDFIPSVIIGAKSVKQLEENMIAGTGWKLTDEQMKRLDDLSSYAGEVPTYPYKFIEMWNALSRRIR